MPNNNGWQDIAIRARKHRDDSIARITPQLSNIPVQLPLNVTNLPEAVLTPFELEVTDSPPEKILEELALGTWSSVQVTKAFLRRAALSQKLVNCITELLPEEALKRATRCDEFLAENRHTIGPLHGLPVSLKEMVCVKDQDVNAAFCAWFGTIAKENAWLVDDLLSAGCVLYARTTQPQTLMHLETSSNLYGTTTNPYNTNLTAGGSSGGEGALLGLKGSCLGVGTDIGGSIRQPAANNGVYGLRPTSTRLSLSGLSHSMEGTDHIMPVIGPMSTSLAGIDIFMRAALSRQPWLRDPSLVPLPWKRPGADLIRSKTNIKIAVMWDDGIVKPLPPIERALRTVVEKLSRFKHGQRFSIDRWEPYKHDEAWEIISSLYFADGGAEESAAIAESGEPWRPLSRWIIPDNPFVRNLSIAELWKLTSRRDAFRSQYAKLWDKSGEKCPVDVILCPASPGPACPIDCTKYWGYTSIWNLLDYPSLVFPVTSVDQVQDSKDVTYQPRNEQDKRNQDLYNPSSCQDAPIGLQLVGRRFRDEDVVAICSEIEQALKESH